MKHKNRTKKDSLGVEWHLMSKLMSKKKIKLINTGIGKIGWEIYPRVLCFMLYVEKRVRERERVRESE